MLELIGEAYKEARFLLTRDNGQSPPDRRRSRLHTGITGLFAYLNLRNLPLLQQLAGIAAIASSLLTELRQTPYYRGQHAQESFA